MNPDEWKKLKELNSKGFISIFLPGYKINKWITSGFFFSCVFLILFALYFEGNLTLEKKYYLACNSPTNCENPYYLAASCPPSFNCAQEYLNPGETWGNPPSKALKAAPLALSLFIFAGLWFNHLLYNVRYDFKKAFRRLRELADNNNGDN